MIKLLLVDDQPSVRQGLRMRLALEPDIAVVGEAADGAAALAEAELQRPDIVVMDLEMPVMDGIAATQALREQDPASTVVLLSIHDDAATQARAHVAGAAGFVSKCGGVESLITAIRRLALVAGPVRGTPLPEGRDIPP